jgi:Uma2 family endonuclease
VPARGKRGYFSGAPDLAIEVLSPEDRPREIREKVDGYLARGVPLVVVIDPNRKTATTFRPGTPSVALRSEIDVLDLNDVIPGFSCELREIFQ